MADGPQFRVADASDAELLLDFMQAYYALDGFGYDREKARAAVIPLLQNPNFGAPGWFSMARRRSGTQYFASGTAWSGLAAMRSLTRSSYAKIIAAAAGAGRLWPSLKTPPGNLGSRLSTSESWKATTGPCVYTKQSDSANIKALSYRSGLQRMSPSPRDRATRVRDTGETPKR
jgi:hypothetical protein